MPTYGSGGTPAAAFDTSLIGSASKVASRPAQGNTGIAFAGGFNGASNPFTTPAPLQDPGNNLVNPGYGEQALNYTQNRLLEDPYAQTQQNLATQAGQPSAGQTYLNENLGTLDGPGQGAQYWQGQQGQFNSPFAGEQYTREATQNFSPTGAAGAFNDQAQGQYDNFTGYTGAGNAQGQYGASSAQIGNGTIGQNNMANIASGYGSNGQYTGDNLAAGQYAQTQGAFGDMPLPDSADPYYDRAIQLGTQSYNQGAAGRGVYGSSEALSGVGNIITDLNAKRAQTTFGNQMAIEQEQRARQELLGNQARMGDLSGTDAFNANMKGVETYGNLNNQMGQLQNQSMDILGNQANAADTQRTNAQNSSIAGMSALGNIANNADRAETDRYTASNTAMNNADQTQLDRAKTGADIAFGVDDQNRNNYTASSNAATAAGTLDNNRLSTASDIAHTGSQDDLNRLNAFNDTAQGAENQRVARQVMQIDAVRNMTKDLQNVIGGNLQAMFSGSQQDMENTWNTEIAPYLQEAGYDQQQISQIYDSINAAAGVVRASKSKGD
jgi:hypothetical protein